MMGRFDARHLRTHRRSEENARPVDRDARKGPKKRKEKRKDDLQKAKGSKEPRRQDRPTPAGALGRNGQKGLDA